VVTANRNKRIDRIRRDLMNNLTHELKTPISTIGLASEALSDSDMRKDEDTAKHYLGLIREENKRLSILVENVLQASVADQGSMRIFHQPLNIHDILREVVRNNAIAIRKQKGKVQWELNATDPVCEVDRIHFTNVVYNLIDNALKYSNGEPKLTISSRQVTNGIELRFQDNGIGIPKEDLGKVFDRLFRVPTGNVHDVKGFGLGLSYVQTVIERHNGAIWVESEVGTGSQFILRLPKEQLNPGTQD
jgi:two-component system phosphate regulon sensor histidine kinase PhoR